VKGSAANASLWNELPWRRFAAFASPQNRFQNLSALLTECKLPFSVVCLSGGKKPASHFFISPAKGGEAETVLIAHYDCADGSPGANDNAAAVFILIETALKLLNVKKTGWFIILTDNEELESGESLRGQGSFALANFFRNGARNTRGEKQSAERNLHPVFNAMPKFFIFDLCGTGGTLIISTMADYLLKTEKGAGTIDIQKDFAGLRRYAMAKAEETARAFLLMPVPFSDDGGFLRAGLAAQLITALPAAEASAFAARSRSDPLCVNALINGRLRKTRDPALFPETWRIMNTPDDTIERLTPEHFGGIVRFAAALCGA
jgi:hypothetical protein